MAAALLLDGGKLWVFGRRGTGGSAQGGGSVVPCTLDERVSMFVCILAKGSPKKRGEAEAQGSAFT